MGKHLSFVHFLWHKDLKFNSALVSLFRNAENNIDANSHIFVTPFFDVYNSLCQYPGVILYDEKQYRFSSIVNQYASKYDYIILHNINYSREVLKIQKKYLKKIIWRTWGENRLGILHYRHSKDPIWWKILLPIRYFVDCQVIKKVNQFAAIGIANQVDLTELHKKFSYNIKTFNMPYPLQNNDVFLDIYNKKNTTGTINVLIGHSGYPNDNHINIYNQLKVYKENNISIYFVLSYGDAEYINNVKNILLADNTMNFKIIDSFMDYKDYLVFLSSIDIGIFDGLNSYALGNIEALISFDKKLYLNKKGIIAKTFEEYNVPFEDTGKIGNISYDDFVCSKEFDDLTKQRFGLNCYEYYVNQWKEIIKYFESIN